MWLWVDPTRRCNISCRLCYARPGQAPQDLSPQVFATLLDRIEGSSEHRICELTLNWRGEPLMNPAFEDLLHILRARGVTYPVQFHTNCTLLTPGRARKLIQAIGTMPSRIYLSLDGGSRASHDANRGVGTFQRAVTGALSLVSARGRRRTPRLILYQLDLGVPYRSYHPGFKRLIGVTDAWQMVRPELPGDWTAIRMDLPSSRGARALLSLRSPGRVPPGPCFWAGNSLAIAPNGDASICVLSNRHDGVLGNVLTEPVDHILDRARNWRARLLEDGRVHVPHCASCEKPEGGGALPHSEVAVSTDTLTQEA